MSNDDNLTKQLVEIQETLQRRNDEYEDLQLAFDDLAKSSKEFEEELEIELRQAEEKVSDLTTQKVKLESALEKLTTRSLNINQNIANLQSEKLEYETKYDNLLNEKRKLEQKNDELEQNLRNLKASEDDKKYQLEQLMEEKIFLTNDLEEISLEYEQEKERWRSEKLDLETSIKAKDLKISSSLNNNNDNINNNNDNNEMNDLKDKLKNSEKKIEDLTEENILLSNELVNMEEEIDILKKENSASPDNEESLKLKTDEILELEEQLIDLEQTNNELMQEISNTSNELIEKTNEIHDLEKKIVENNELIEKLTNLNTEKNNEIDQLKLELTESNIEIKNRDEIIIDLKSRLEQQQEKVDKLRDVVVKEKRKSVVLMESKNGLVSASSLSSGTFTDSNDLNIEDNDLDDDDSDNNNNNNNHDNNDDDDDVYIEPNKINNEDNKNRITVDELNKLKIEWENEKEKYIHKIHKLEEEISFKTSNRRTSLVLPTNASKNENNLRNDIFGNHNQFDIVITEENKDDDVVKQYLALKEKYVSQRITNSKLLTKMQQVIGNIQVCCRIRPPLSKEISDGATICVESLSEEEVGYFDKRLGAWKSFAFDHVWGVECNQQDVFQDVEPLALSVVDGFNACIFAYGQTGSGKTHTMMGIPENGQYGVSYRILYKIFESLKFRADNYSIMTEKFQGKKINNNNNDDDNIEDNESKDDNQGFEYSIHVSMVEIYNEDLYDLLSEKDDSEDNLKSFNTNTNTNNSNDYHNSSAQLNIRRIEGQVQIPGLVRQEVHELEDVIDLMEKGNQNRATASTNINEHSSRSHSILIVEVTTTKNDGENPICGRLYLVDLAGSERISKSEVTGQQLKEAQHINKSLSSLGDVMEALDQKQKHIPYRNSKLTYLLQDSLGGNSRTLMIVTICPTDLTNEETRFTLQFATRVRNIHLGPARRNVSTKNLQESIKSLRRQLHESVRKKEKSEEQISILKKEYKRNQQRMSTVMDARTRSVDEYKTSYESQISHLKKVNSELQTKLYNEKAINEKKLIELNDSKKMAKKLREQLNISIKEKQHFEYIIKEKDEEIKRVRKKATEITTKRRNRYDTNNSLNKRNDIKTNAKKKRPQGSYSTPLNRTNSHNNNINRTNSRTNIRTKPNNNNNIRNNSRINKNNSKHRNNNNDDEIDELDVFDNIEIDEDISELRVDEILERRLSDNKNLNKMKNNNNNNHNMNDNELDEIDELDDIDEIDTYDDIHLYNDDDDHIDYDDNEKNHSGYNSPLSERSTSSSTRSSRLSRPNSNNSIKSGHSIKLRSSSTDKGSKIPKPRSKSRNRTNSSNSINNRRVTLSHEKRIKKTTTPENRRKTMASHNIKKNQNSGRMTPSTALRTAEERRAAALERHMLRMKKARKR